LDKTVTKCKPNGFYTIISIDLWNLMMCQVIGSVGSAGRSWKWKKEEGMEGMEWNEMEWSGHE
jgi:hypothetical protein